MLGRRRRPEDDFSEELKAHLALDADRLRSEGVAEEQAGWQARRNLGNLASNGERFFESNRWMWLEHLVEDTRYAVRRLRKAPVFAVTALATIALGIGATTSIFTLVNAVLLKSLAVAKPGELYRLGKETHCCFLGGFSQNNGFSVVSYDLYKHLRDHTSGFSELAGFSAGQPRVGVRRAQSAEAAGSYPAEFVSGNYFAMFGINAYAGRTIADSDDQSGAAPVAVMSYRLWREKYGSDAAVIGGVFNVNDKPVTVVGIAPPSFFGDALRDTPTDLFLPLASEPIVQGDNSVLRSATAHWLDLIGRIQPGVKRETVEAQMRVELQQWLRSHWGEMDANERQRLPEQTLYLSPGGAGITSMREQYEHWLEILMAAAGLVLLIVCANVANLMLVRGMERRQQTSLSMALGARPMRMVRQALTESVVLALAGGAAGIVVAFAGTRLILDAVFPTSAGFGSVPISASPSMAVLAFAFGISMVTGVLFGIAPAWMATRVDPIEALRGSHRTTRRAGSLPRKTLVVLQAALAMVLLSASGLLTAALRHLEHQDFGFEQEGRTIVNIDPTLGGYRAGQLDSLYRHVHDSLAGMPGVASVAICLYSPLAGDSWNSGIFVGGRPAPGPRDDNSSSWDRVSAGYSEAIGTPILQGRDIGFEDTAASRHVAVINQAFARKFFRNENPIGKHFGRTDIAASQDFEVVGVVKDARHMTYNFDRPVGPLFFVPEPQYTAFAKADQMTGEIRSHFLHDVVVQMKPGAAALADAAVRRAIAAVEPNLPVLFVGSLKQQVDANFGQQRLIAQLTSLFGFLALVLASIGVYGVTAYNAGSRTSEIGVRIALGANRAHILRLVLGGALAMIALGLALGVPLLYVVGKFLGSQLYGMNPYDPEPIAIAVAALGLAAAAAALIPAMRASSISPVEALRAE